MNIKSDRSKFITIYCTAVFIVFNRSVAIDLLTVHSFIANSYTSTGLIHPKHEMDVEGTIF